MPSSALSPIIPVADHSTSSAVTISHHWEFCNSIRHVDVDHQCKVAYVLPIGTKINDLRGSDDLELPL